MTDVEETMKKLDSHKGVMGNIISTKEGSIIRGQVRGESPENTQKITALFSNLAAKAAEAIKSMDTSNQLSFIRVRSKKYEVMIAPGDEFIMITLQQPHD